MTDKKLKVNSAAYTELSIQIAVLQASVDKLLELAMKPEIECEIVNTINGLNHFHVGASGSLQDRVFSPQWPNESRTDCLKRMGQYIEAYSDNEKFDGEFK